VLKQRAVGIFSDHARAERALAELKASGFAMDAISIVGRDESHNLGTAATQHDSPEERLRQRHDDDRDKNPADAAKKGAVAGTALGGVTGLLVGLGLVAIPGVGPIMMAGAAATAIATALSGGAIGAAAGSLAGGLTALEVPEERAQNYSRRVDAGEYLVMVEGSVAQITAAEKILHQYGIQDWFAYDLPDRDRNATPQTTSYLEH
jgi:hypothetical protein